MSHDIIFEILSRVTSKIFKNRDVLRPDYIPDFLPHREEQIRKLTEILAPLLRGERPSNIFIYGLTGTGKTAVVKFVLKRIKEYSDAKGIKTFTYSYINCRHEDTTYRVLARIAESLGIKVPFTGLSTAEVYVRVKRAIDTLNKILVVVLDEIDFLVKKVGDELLYRLTRINDELSRGKVSVIGITNDVKFMEKLDARVKSSLGEVEILFPPYDALQLTDILRERASKAFQPGAVDDAVIQYCASIAAREHGDARRALDLLRVAGEVAEREGADRVTIDHVKRAREEIERDMVMEVIRTLPFHGKLVLLTIALRGGKIGSTGELYLRYREIARKIGLEPVTQRRVSDIINELEMLGIVNAKLINRGRYGKTREVILMVDPQVVIKVLGNESKIRWFVGSS
ncbi:MAG TPA: ORC1-type DNA replication protein [Acidilobales archaeon]|nr:ORC1-type DNA replication protein [Acidilobales archaeon]